MPIRRVERPSKEAISRDQKRKRLLSSGSESDDNVQMVKRRPGRPRKDATSHQGTSERGDSKKSRPSNHPESEDDDWESRPRRKSARCVTYQESDSDFDDSPIQKKTERRTVDSRKDALSSSSSSADSSSSELDFPIGDSDSEEETENEQEEEATQKAINKPGGTRKARDESRRKRTKYTEEQTKILQAALRETINPSFEQRIKLAEETNLSLVQVRKWINNNRQENPEWLKARESNPEWLKTRRNTLRRKKQRMEQVFALNRRPDKDMIASLVAELGITKEKVKGWFSYKRYRNPVPEEDPILLCEEDARPILMEYFEKNPRFRDYKNPELKLKTGWPRHRLREFFETCRKEHGTVDSALPPEKAEPFLMEIFLKDPLFSDFKNVELKRKILWSSKKIKEWFRRQRHLNKQNQFRNTMETFFQNCQYPEKRNKDLELESGGAWRRISKWMKNKRKNVLESFLKKEITVNEMPNEMSTFERLYEKYDGPRNEDLILYIEKKENVNGDMFAVYLVERWSVGKKIHPEDVQEEEEEDSDDPFDEGYPDVDYHENEREDVQRAHQEEEDEMESEGYEIGTPDESLIDEDVEDVKDIQLLGNPRVSHIKNEVDDFGDETRNAPRFVPAPGYRDQSQAPDVDRKVYQ